MKTIFTIGVLFLHLAVFGQEAGKAGELLKNEAKSSEMQKQKAEGLRGNTNSFPKNPGTVKPPISNNNGNNGYRWNYNYGNAEVFLRIPQTGNYAVEIDDQLMINSSGKFRFFELRSGVVPIAIYENNFLIYRTRLNVRNSTRLVLDFFPNYGLYLLGNYPVQNQSYGINEWDDIWNNPYGNQTGNGNWNGNTGSNNYYNNVMNPQEFTNFLMALQKNASFDNDKRAMVSVVSRDTNFTSVQVQSILKSMSFDENRLEVAKQLYLNCPDRRNYFVVLESFSFESSKRKLQDFIARF